MDSPRVSILITTYNRSTLLPRAIKSVLKQDFDDYEIIVIDDCSKDDTPQVMAGFSDPRIRYIRNEVNQGAKHGDRAHVRRCVHELMRGRYFVYLCDDDFWLPTDILTQLVAAFEQHPTLSIAIGGHAHTYDRDFGLLNDPNLNYVPVPEVSPLTVHPKKVFPAGFISRQEYLALFADDPMKRNLLVGATMFLREAFLKAGVFSAPTGSRWQAGYEFFIGPAAVGDVFYIDAPCIIAAVEPDNASFRGSQLDHYLDCIKSVEVAYQSVIPALTPKEQLWLKGVRHSFVNSLTQGFLSNRLSYKKGWFDTNPIDHTHMFQRNVTPWQVARVYAADGRIVPPRMLGKAVHAAAPAWLLKGIQGVRHGPKSLPNRARVWRNGIRSRINGVKSGLGRIRSWPSRMRSPLTRWVPQTVRTPLRRGLQKLGVLS